MINKNIKVLLFVTLLLLSLGIVSAAETTDDTTMTNTNIIEKNLATDTNQITTNNIQDVNTENTRLNDNKTVNEKITTSVKEADNTPTKSPTTLYMYPRESADIGSTIKVSGKLLNGSTGIRNEFVNVRVNNNNYYAMTGGYGYFTINYTVTSYGSYDVTFTYDGNDNYQSSTNTSTFYVKKDTNLYIYARNGDKNGDTIKVSGKLQTSGEGIKGEKVNITINNKSYTATTGGYGYFTINYTIDTFDDLNVTFKYPGSNKYLPSKNSTIYIVKKPTTLYMYSRYGDNMGKTIKVSGKLLYNNTSINAETIKIKVNDKTYTTTSDRNGYFTTNHTITSYDDLNVTFTYAGSKNYLSSTNSTVYTVKKPTNLFMYTRSNDKINTTIKVSGKLQTNGTGIKGETVQITVNNKQYNATTGGYGYFTINYTIDSYDDLRVTFKYPGNSKYESSKNTTTYIIKKPTNLFMYNRYGDNMGKTIKVSGKLLFNQTGINNETINIKVNDKQYSAKTDKNGYFTINYIITSYDNLNVTFTYEGNSDYIKSSNSTVYVVKKPTNIFMYQRSNDKINTTIKISGKLQTNGTGIKGETVQITVNNKQYNATTGGYGYFTINYTITTYDNLKITFKYPGNSKYESSKNTTTYIIKKPTNLFMYSRNGDTIGSTIKVSGKLLTDGEALTGENMTITVNGKNYTAKSGGYGYFTVNHTITSYDDLNVTFTYTGNTKYFPTTNSTVYPVKKVPLIYLYNRSGDIKDSVITIVGKLLNENNVGISGETVKVTINNQDYTTKTNEYGIFTVDYSIDSYDNLNATFKFAGNSRYESAINSTVYYVKKPTQLNITEGTRININDTIHLEGTLSYNGTGIQGENIIVTIKDTTYTATTDTNGYFVIEYSVEDYDNFNVTFNYTGCPEYLACKNMTTYKVLKPTKVIIDEIGDVEYGSLIQVTGRVFSDYGKMSNVIVIVASHGGIGAEADENGYFSVDMGACHIGLNYVYAGLAHVDEDDFKISNTTITYNVIKRATKITLDYVEDTNYGNAVTISGRLVDNENDPMVNDKITLNINGENYTITTNKTGYFTLNYEPTSAGYKRVTATFNDTNNYIGSSVSTSFTVSLAKTIIVLDSIEDTEYSNIINIAGKCTDMDGYGLSDVELSLTINGAKYYTNTDNYGDFNFFYQTKKVDVNDITVSYSGDSNHLETTTQTKFTVTAEPTITEIHVYDDPYSSYTHAYVSVSDRSKEDYLNYAPLYMIIDGKTNYVTTNEYGEYSIDLTAKESGTNITASFLGNEYYAPSSDSIIYKKTNNEYKIPTRITVINTVKSTDENYIKIRGRFYDIKGNMLTYTPLTLEIDGVTYTTKTDGTGLYNFNYYGDVNTYHSLKVSYTGNKNYAYTQTRIVFKGLTEGNTLELLTPHTIEYEYDDYGQTICTENYQDITNGYSVYIGSDDFYCNSQYMDGQMAPGVHILQNGIVIEEAPANVLIKAEFYFKNNWNTIIKVNYTDYFDNIIETSLIDGYIPYKAVITFRERTAAEIKEWYSGYEYESDNGG